MTVMELWWVVSEWREMKRWSGVCWIIHRWSSHHVRSGDIACDSRVIVSEWWGSERCLLLKRNRRAAAHHKRSKRHEWGRRHEAFDACSLSTRVECFALALRISGLVHLSSAMGFLVQVSCFWAVFLAEGGKHLLSISLRCHSPWLGLLRWPRLKVTRWICHWT